MLPGMYSSCMLTSVVPVHLMSARGPQPSQQYGMQITGLSSPMKGFRLKWPWQYIILSAALLVCWVFVCIHSRDEKLPVKYELLPTLPWQTDVDPSVWTSDTTFRQKHLISIWAPLYCLSACPCWGFITHLSPLLWPCRLLPGCLMNWGSDVYRWPPWGRGVTLTDAPVRPSGDLPCFLEQTKNTKCDEGYSGTTTTKV